MSQQSSQPKAKERGYPTHRQPYQKISNETREKVITDILCYQKSIKQVAFDYGLKYSTVNGIVQTYQQQGRKCKKARRNKKQCYKRNKLLILINQSTGDIQLYHASQNSNAILLESDQNISRNNDNSFDCFRTSTDCQTEFVQRDFEIVLKKLMERCLIEHQKVIKMSFIHVQVETSLNSFENTKAEIDGQLIKSQNELDSNDESLQSEPQIYSNQIAVQQRNMDLSKTKLNTIQNITDHIYSSKLAKQEIHLKIEDCQPIQQSVTKLSIAESMTRYNYEEAQAIWEHQIRIMTNTINF